MPKIVCINVGYNSMSFGTKISNGFGVTSHQIWKCEKKSILVWKFVFSTLMACDSKTIGNFGTKTHGIVSHINANNWAKIGAFIITFK